MSTRDQLTLKSGNVSNKSTLVSGLGPRTGGVAHENLYQYDSGTEVTTGSDSDIEIQEVLTVYRNTSDTSANEDSFVSLHGGTLESHALSVNSNPSVSFQLDVGSDSVTVSPGGTENETATAIADAIRGDSTLNPLYLAEADGSGVTLTARRMTTRHRTVTSDDPGVAVTSTAAALGNVNLEVDQIVNREHAYASETQGQVNLEDASAARSSTYNSQNNSVSTTHSPENQGEIVFPGGTRMARYRVTAAQLVAAGSAGDTELSYALAFPHPGIADRAVIEMAYFETVDAWTTTNTQTLTLGLGSNEGASHAYDFLTATEMTALGAGEIYPTRAQHASPVEVFGKAVLSADNFVSFAGFEDPTVHTNIVPCIGFGREVVITKVTVTYLHDTTAFSAGASDTVTFTVGKIPSASAPAAGNFTGFNGAPHITLGVAQNGTYPVAEGTVNATLTQGDRVAVQVDITNTPGSDEAGFIVELQYQSTSGLGEAIGGQWMFDSSSGGHQLALNLEMTGSDTLGDLTGGSVDVYVMYRDLHHGVSSPSSYATVYTR